MCFVLKTRTRTRTDDKIIETYVAVNVAPVDGVGARFQTRIISLLEQVTNEPVGKTPFMLSLDDEYAAWYKNECNLPTYLK